MRIDLHTHTTASDGLLNPRDLVHAARRAGVGVLGVTDHDTVDGIPEALEAAPNLGVTVVPGVELSVEYGEEELHLLGYFVDHRAGWFRDLLQELRASRVDRIREMVCRLRRLGVSVSFDEVTRSGQGAVGRAHLARALVSAGFVRTPAEAFERYLGRGKPAWVPRSTLSLEEALRAIREAGGLAILAHPGRSRVLAHVAALKAAGLDGIEVYYPEHTPQQVERLLALARDLGLLVTGGSDYHGDGVGTGATLGGQYVPPEVVRALEERRRVRDAVSEMRS
ncbi:MAG: PHP domain-containing protein [Armatimonadota bacterium]|nr:PHP domain-containing protein [Armatimonadota bacterium]MDR7443319.1 PHP domain-containing protein [Armatimonadota bacterium]MDR7570457.1 PHP domain-containing protein [Armatimonadota bacterium]MDR7614351.1 PHP domain-containing protein [Armatimonadota bacterium]